MTPAILDLARVEAVVVGGSAGAMDGLGVILPALPRGLAVPVLVVLHVPPDDGSRLPFVFEGRCQVAVREAEDKDSIVPGVAFAPPGYHLLVETDRTLALSVDAAVHFSRPSIDVLFESAAYAYGERLLGIVLSGANEDGAAGLAAIAAAGGIAVVQAPETADSPEMPEGALRAVAGAHVLAPDAIARLVGKLRAGPETAGGVRR
jgi:two-component system, chemotaxis family, protein-glutamate methylesterase/glutaminase